MSEDSVTPKLSRRDLLKHAAVTSLHIVTRNWPKPESKESYDTTNFVLIDTTYGNTKDILPQALKDDYRDIGAGTPEFKAHIDEYLHSSDPGVIKTALVYMALESREGHGARMQANSGAMAENLGWQLPLPTLLPLEPAISAELITNEEENPLKNPTLRIRIDTDSIIQTIQSYKNKNPNLKIVNMSFQVGVSEFEYQEKRVGNVPVTIVPDTRESEEGGYGRDMLVVGKFDGYAPNPAENDLLTPYIEVRGEKKFLKLYPASQLPKLQRDYEREAVNEFKRNGNSEKIHTNSPPLMVTTEAYNAEFAQSNFMEMIKLCGHFPDILFVASGGNEYNNFYDVRQELESKGVWPENLLLAGGINRGRVEADGCDIYLDGESNGGYMYSSQASDAVSTVCNLITKSIPRQMTVKEIKARVLGDRLSDPLTYRGLGKSKPLRSSRLLNAEKLESRLGVKG